MADEQNPNDPRYDWLYSGQSGPGREGDSAEAGDTNDGADPDATQMISRRDARGGDASDDAAEHTRVLGSQPRPEDTSSAGAQTFGGTYDRPQRESPRFAEPSQAGGGGQQSGARTSYAPPPKRRKRRRWWLRGIITVIILWLIFLVATPIYAWSKISQVDADPGGNRPADTPGTTYLLVGSDSREGLTKAEQNDLGTGAAAGQRTDTIILLHVTSGDGPNVMLSIPRDSYVDIPGHGKGKINASFAYGGADLLVQTVERATDVRVDDYIEIGFGGVVDTVDAVGGITVCPKQQINDPKAGHLKMSPGCQEVNGHIALDYARSRHFANGDITRALHQREVIGAVGDEAASWQTVVFPWRYWRINMAAAESLHVGEDVGPIDLGRFGWAMAHSGGKDTKRCVVPYSTLGASTSAGSSVLWDESKAEALFQSINDDDTSSIHCKPQ